MHREGNQISLPVADTSARTANIGYLPVCMVFPLDREGSDVSLAVERLRELGVEERGATVAA